MPLIDHLCQALVLFSEQEMRRFGHLYCLPHPGDPEGKEDFGHLVDRLTRHVEMRMAHLEATMISPRHDVSLFILLEALGRLHGLNEARGRPLSWSVFVQEKFSQVMRQKEDHLALLLPSSGSSPSSPSPLTSTPSASLAPPEVPISSRPPEERTFSSFVPWALTTSVKAHVLHADCIRRQHHQLQDAFFRALFIGVNSPFLELRIRRDRLVRDAVYQLERYEPLELQKALKVQFVGEEGVDEGGLRKEFFSLLAREVFRSDYGMFTWRESSRLCWFTSMPDPTSESSLLLSDRHTGVSKASGEPGMAMELEGTQKEEYRLVGIMLGLAIYNNVQLEVKFPAAAYKRLCGQPVGLEDLCELDPVSHMGNGWFRAMDLLVEPCRLLTRLFYAHVHE